MGLMRVAAALTLLVLSILSVAGCAKHITASQMVADPERYYGSVILIEGLVSNGHSVAGYGVYELRDATGSVKVVSRAGVPETGTVVRVRGRVNAPIEFGVVTIGTHIAEDSREAP